MSAPALTCVSILLCESAYWIARTEGNLVIANAFNVMRVSAFPAFVPKITMIFSLTDARGQYELTMSVIDAESGEPVTQFTRPFRVDNPLVVTDLVAEVNGIRIPKPGRFWLELKSDGNLMAQRPFHVLPNKPPPAGGAARPKPPNDEASAAEPEPS
jgi:hypothetical protein